MHMVPVEVAVAWLQGDPAWNEQAQGKDGQGLSLTLTLWDQDCVVTVDELSKLPLAKMAKLYTVGTEPSVLSACSFKCSDRPTTYLGGPCMC